MRRDLIVIGASAGGLDPVRSIVSALPRDLAAAVCLVLHTPPDAPGILSAMLERSGRLPAIPVHGSERLRPGYVYVAQPDRHLVVEPSLVCATKGPKENGFRPAVDPLFRSAAQTYGPRVVGVVLSGGLDDGTAGLWAIKRLGGIAVVQDPEDALVDSMPRNALRHVKVDHRVSVAAMPELLIRLVTEDLVEAGGYSVPDHMKIEVKIAREDAALPAGVIGLGQPSTYACPECHGVLRRIEEGGRVRYRCHTGHAYSAESLVADMERAIEESLWSSVRALQEKILLVRELEGHARASHDDTTAELLRQLGERADVRADLVRRAALRPDGASDTKDAPLESLQPSSASTGE